jgi:thiamine pyrophosphokinase
VHYLIIANGKISNLGFYKSKIKSFDKIVCADGGYNLAKKLNSTPDVIIGDLDSLNSKNIDKSIEIIKYPKNKDKTDLELAIHYCKKHRAKKISIIGGFGGRIDHLLNNLNILKENILICFFDEGHEIFKISSNTILSGKKGEIISFFPLSFPLKSIKTFGLKYPFTEKWFSENRFSVSNEFKSKKIKILIKRGSLLVIRIKS